MDLAATEPKQLSGPYDHQAALAITFDKISIRCRSRSLIAINPIRNLPRHQTPGV
jgi:hypothetical protein